MMHTFILGGVGSGKTEKACSLVSPHTESVHYISTQINEVRPIRFPVITCDDDLPSLISSLQGTLIIDNIFPYYASLVQRLFASLSQQKDDFEETVERVITQHRDALIASIAGYEDDLIIISSVVGLGLIPPTKEERLLRDELGRFNQELAKISHTVIMMVAGIATTIKKTLPPPPQKEKGIFYGVSVGPGNSEMMTYQAVQTLESVTTLIIPQTKSKKSIALDIISGLVDLSEKKIIPVFFPMTYNQQVCDDNYRMVAHHIGKILATGVDVAMPVLGDISIYSTFANLSHYVEEQGYVIKVMPGVPSFVAAADAFHLRLLTRCQTMSIISCADPQLKQRLQKEGTKVVMKIGKQLPLLKKLIMELHLENNVYVALNVGMKNQRLVTDITTLSENEGYLAVVLITDPAA